MPKTDEDVTEHQLDTMELIHQFNRQIYPNSPQREKSKKGKISKLIHKLCFCPRSSREPRKSNNISLSEDTYIFYPDTNGRIIGEMKEEHGILDDQI